jgi:hypothetical protein
MRRSISSWWPSRQRMSRHTQEPGSGLFQGLRMRLTLWYCGMLGMALVLFGVVLYFGTQYFLLTPIETDAALHAHIHAELWLTGSLDRACPFLVSSDQSGLFSLPRISWSRLIDIVRLVGDRIGEKKHSLETERGGHSCESDLLLISMAISSR